MGSLEQQFAEWWRQASADFGHDTFRFLPIPAALLPHLHATGCVNSGWRYYGADEDVARFWRGRRVNGHLLVRERLECAPAAHGPLVPVIIHRPASWLATHVLLVDRLPSPPPGQAGQDVMRAIWDGTRPPPPLPGIL